MTRRQAWLKKRAIGGWQPHVGEVVFMPFRSPFFLSRDGVVLAINFGCVKVRYRVNCRIAFVWLLIEEVLPTDKRSLVAKNPKPRRTREPEHLLRLPTNPAARKLRIRIAEETCQT